MRGIMAVLMFVLAGLDFYSAIHFFSQGQTGWGVFSSVVGVWCLVVGSLEIKDFY